jgi:hypothetical protein
MDIFDTSTLNAVVENLDRPQSFLLDAFFRQEQRSTTEHIEFHVGNKLARLAPFVSPLKAGKAVPNEGYTAKTFKPAYVKDKRQFNPNDMTFRTIGEQIGGSLSPQARLDAAVARSLADQLDMLTRREEWMASEVLRNGKVTITGEGYPAVEVDFGRHADLTQTLAGGARWGEAGVAPMTNVETWFGTMATRGGGATTDVVMGPSAWALFADSPRVEKLLRRDIGQNGAVQFFVNPTGEGTWAQLQGTIGTVRYWTYQQPYVDDAGADAKMLNDHDVLLVNSGGLMGTRAYGLIRDLKSNLTSQRYFVKSWEEEDPSVRWLLMQSAPLMVPYRPNSSMRVQVR